MRRLVITGLFLLFVVGIALSSPRATSASLTAHALFDTLDFTVTPTDTPTDTPTNTPTATPTDTPTATPTATPTNTPTDTPTATPTNTPTDTPTDTPTATPTNTPTDTPTDTPTNTPTDTPTNTPTNTPTDTPTPPPAPPIANDDSATTNEDQAVTIAVLANDQSFSGGALTIVTLTQPANGTAQLNNDGTVTYTPKPDFNGSDQFIYVVSDGFSYSLPATVTITVQPVNDAPTIAVAAGGRCMSDGSPNGTINLTVGDIDSPVSGLTLHVVSNSNIRLVPNANIVFGVINASTRTMSISAAPRQKGSAAITVGVTDSAGATSTLVVTVFVGTDKDDKIDGTNGADMIFGLNGKNALNGKGGNDLICGGNSIDTISGGDGDDTLVGENGNDRMTGGSGADSFSGGLGTDTATDFTPAEGDTKDATVEIS